MTLKYYEILGLSQISSEEDIKKAYKKLALKLHPDKGGSTEEFKELQTAYDTLKDIKNKNLYDQINNHEEYIKRKLENNNSNSNFFNVNINIRKYPDIISDIQISLEDIYKGCKKNIKVELNTVCFSCKSNCNICNGTGILFNIIQQGPFMIQQQFPCNNCKGLGIIYKNSTSCSVCNGSCEYIQIKIIQLDIPINTQNGYKIKLDGLGEQKQKENDISGDLYIIIKVLPHNIFERHGDKNLIYKTFLTWKESVIGKKLEIPLFDGIFILETHTLGVIQGDKHYYIKDKGLQGGDLICIFNVDYPILNEDLRKKFEDIIN